ncbi:MAG: single-stranded-DNA-specific exonuclease RecJ [bacterium]
MPKCKWNVKSTVSEKAKKLSKFLGLSSVTAQVLINRGLDNQESIKDFFEPSLSKLPDPFALSDMKKAAERLADAIEKKETICIYGDYDIDGSTSIVTIVTFLRTLNVDVKYYQPERFVEGYGLHIDSVKKIHKDGANLLISVDCGTSSMDTAEYCKKVGIDLIITDHHKVGAQTPDAYAFVNPHKVGEDSAFSCLAGVGVSYYLVIATRKVLRDRGFFKDDNEPDLKSYLDIVAFGTIADVVPLMGVNRILVRKGLDIINNNSRIGLSALIEVSGLKTQVNSDALGFILAPRLNAAGRMGNASRSVELLLSNSEVEAKQLASVLNEENQKRMSFQNKSWKEVQSIVEKMCSDQNKEIFEKRFTLTFANEDWHQGIIGIVASKSAEKWYKPTSVYTIGSNGIAKGSARSIPGVDIFSVFLSFKEIFEDFGGHNMASGMSIKSDRLPKFEEMFEQGVGNYIKSKKLLPVLNIDVELGIDDISMRTVTELSQIEPFGVDNPQPLFFSSDVKVLNKWILKDKHLKLKLENGIDAIGFNMSNLADSLGSTIDLVFKPSINEWNGNRSLQYIIVDVE